MFVQLETEWRCIYLAGYKTFNVYKASSSRLTPTAIPTFPHPSLYVGDFNCQHANKVYSKTSPECESLDSWATANSIGLLHDPKWVASFSYCQWNVGTNPDLAFASVGQDSRLPDRRILGKFPRSQHWSSLIMPPKLTVPAYSDGDTRLGAASPPGQSRRSCPTYGKSQHLRETISLAASRQRSLLPPLNTWSQENLVVWIPPSRSLCATPGCLPNLGFAISSLFLTQDMEKSTNSCDSKAGKAFGDLKIFCPISPLCVHCTIFERLIYARVEPIIDPLLPQGQAGFRRGRSTAAQVTLVTQDIEDIFSAKKKTRAVLVLEVNIQFCFSTQKSAGFHVEQF